ncbi:hypothetical protein SCUCBS95973_008166 [Sporothrix curviconia]|uniref:RRM domain-containing protein n=1 Tax=Sporothrix curviconia TaxID=1260050 RepID=A0ABP0CM40_9PEZI
MLHCQYSFGSVIGAPVVFFLGGFIFALLQSLDTLGDEDIAEGLAFGQWYMTIPHIAIVSGLLLAGNNPNIMEGVLAVERKYPQDNITFMGITYGLAYPSCYKVAWLWEKWLDTLIATYLVRYNAVYSGNEDYDKDMLWAYAGPLAVFNVEKPGLFRISGWLDKRGFYEPYSVRWMVDRGQAVPRNPFKLMRLIWNRNNSRRLINWRCLWNIVYYSSQWLLGIIGITAAIGGTAMQLMGVYSADICYITTSYWFAPLDKRPQPIISVNSADMIRESELMWKPCAITAIVFMSVVSFDGGINAGCVTCFKTVRRIDQNERRDTRASRPDRGRVRPRATSGAPLTVRTLTPSIPTAAPIAPRTMSGASASTAGYGGYGSYSGQSGGQGRAYGSLGGRNSMTMMSGALPTYGHGSNAGLSSSLSAQGSAVGPGSYPPGSGSGSLSGRTPSPMGTGGVGSMPDGGSSGTFGFAPQASGISGPSGNAPPATGLDASSATGPSRRTPFRRAPSLNEPLEEADEPSSHSVRRAVLRSAASASASVARTATSTSTTPLIRSVAAQAARRPVVNTLAIAARYFSQTARVAEEATSATATPAADTAAAPAEQGARPSNEGETPYGVYIRNIVFDATEAHLKEAFEHYGPVSRCVIARDARGMSRGYGFVWFESQDAKDKAKAEANGSFWHGRRLEVGDRQARTRTERPARAERAPNQPSDSLYIGNLPYETTDADLNAVFGDLKGLLAVRVAVDRATGWPRGFAHADFDTEENATVGLQYLKDKQVGSRQLRVDFAQASRKRADRYNEKSGEKPAEKPAEKAE